MAAGHRQARRPPLSLPDHRYSPYGRSISYEPIGEISTPFDRAEGMPIQPPVAADTTGVVELDPEYAPALQDLEGFSHCILLYHFHASEPDSDLTVTPFLDATERGLFATRAPRRPNSIGLSVVAIDAVEDATLTVTGIDVLDGTPLLDVKPFVPEFDVPERTESGWIAAAADEDGREYADDRFV
ncbi:tRNA (N6-threonylcarbamoyladenosine(37)-N6)-methyltransferase TrmO [Halapricum hydrolyticum]|uniref:tRNA (N6-threonylcarbamoyladenosine(37)-N6)-methyltransferase TrmO n=1 Tax=Halapricum hydrolyticum TaxID=2979991 RepID=UPI0028F701C2|nr:tRNA (N6-threonylcarbamoyladenosine(37)-N6)-methyltransferase TrmO [Halapricum hydrolyticum]